MRPHLHYEINPREVPALGVKAATEEIANPQWRRDPPRGSAQKIELASIIYSSSSPATPPYLIRFEFSSITLYITSESIASS